MQLTSCYVNLDNPNLANPDLSGLVLLMIIDGRL